MIYERDPDTAPDEDFEPGELGHAVVGNEGRMLDPRRTPVRVVEVRPATGYVVVEITAFEDEGACWEIEVERLDRYQFARGSSRAKGMRLAELEDAVRRLDRPLALSVDAEERERSGQRLAAARGEARDWLDGHAVRIDLSSRTGDPGTWTLLSAFVEERGLLEMERAFAERYVSNPGSGELVKGHRIVAAELGLAPYVGTVVRDPTIFDGAWSRERRAEHLLARLAFVPELFRAAGHDRVTLWRGMSSEQPFDRRPQPTFVSATFSREVAESHFAGNEKTVAAMLSREVVPVERLFMTYVETEAMNRQFLEAEGVLIAGADGSTG